MTKTILLILVMFLLALYIVSASSVLLQEADTELIFDTQTVSDNDVPLGDETYITIGHDYDRRAYVMFRVDAARFTPELTIEEAYLRLTAWSATGSREVQVHEVNSTWDEDVLKHSAQPCGTIGTTEFDEDKCNVTFVNKTLTSDVVETNYTFNVTSAVKRAIREERGNISFMLNWSSGDTGSNNILFRSKESDNETQIPMLNISFIGNDVNFTIRDEFNDEMINDNVTLKMVSAGYSTNYTITEGFQFVEGMPDGEYRIEFQDTAEKYSKRNYYFTLDNLTAETVDLYLLSAGNSTDVTFKVTDTSGNDLENSTIWLKRYFVASNSYKTVAMERTNFEGETIINVDYNDAFYQILAEYGDFSVQTIGAKIISTTLYLTIDLITDPFKTIDVIDGVTSSMSFNNLTQTFSYTFTDTSGTSRTGVIEVYRSSPTVSDMVCSSTDTSSSATVLCQVNTTNLTGSYSAKGYIVEGENKVLTASFDVLTGITEELSHIFGPRQGPFFAVLVAGTLGLLGAAVSPVVGVLVFIVALAAVNLFGLSPILTGAYGIIVITGLVLIYRLKS